MILLLERFLLMGCPFHHIIYLIIARASRSSVKSQRASTFYVPDNRLYQGSIRFNILLGANREVTQEEIDNAAKDANVFSFPVTILTIDF
jgi:ABC-type multidrug transport system fused ATPase/permease subunit